MVLYVVLQKELFGCLRPTLVFYLKVVAVDGIGFWLKPFDPCVANKMINSYQMTLTFHLDDVKISHKEPKVVDEIIRWFKSMYGDEVQVLRAIMHNHLGMMLSFSDRCVLVSMADCVKKIINNFMGEMHRTIATPAREHLFLVHEDADQKLLDEEWVQCFHSTVFSCYF